MIAEKIRSVSSALGVLAGQVTEEQWQFIKMAKSELADAADTAEEMESRLEAPRPGEEASPLGPLSGLVEGLKIALGPDRIIKRDPRTAPVIVLVRERLKDNRPAPPPPSEIIRRSQEAADGQA